MSTVSRRRKRVKKRASAPKVGISESRKRRLSQVAAAALEAEEIYEYYGCSIPPKKSRNSTRGRPPRTHSRHLARSASRGVQKTDSRSGNFARAGKRNKTTQDESTTETDPSGTTGTSDSRGRSSHKPASGSKADACHAMGADCGMEESSASLPSFYNTTRTFCQRTLSEGVFTPSVHLFDREPSSADVSHTASMTDEQTSGSKRKRPSKTLCASQHSLDTSSPITSSESRYSRAAGSAYDEANDTTQQDQSDVTFSTPTVTKAATSRCVSEHAQARKRGRSTSAAQKTRSLGQQAVKRTRKAVGKANESECRDGEITHSASVDGAKGSSTRRNKSQKSANRDKPKGSRRRRTTKQVEDATSALSVQGDGSLNSLKCQDESVDSASATCSDQDKAKQRTTSPGGVKGEFIDQKRHEDLDESFVEASGSTLDEVQAETQVKKSGSKRMSPATSQEEHEQEDESTHKEHQGLSDGQQLLEAIPAPKTRKRTRKSFSDTACLNTKAAAEAFQPAAKRRRVTRKSRKTKKEEKEALERELEKELVTLQQVRKQCLSLGLRQYFDMRAYIRRVWRQRNDAYKDMQLSPKTLNLLNACLALVFQMISAEAAVLMVPVRKSTLDEHFLQDAIRELMPDSETYAYMMDQEGRRCLRQFYQTMADDRLARILGDLDSCCRCSAEGSGTHVDCGEEEEEKEEEEEGGPRTSCDCYCHCDEGEEEEEEEEENMEMEGETDCPMVEEA